MESQTNSKKLCIDKNITQIRKDNEDKWVRSLHTQYPFGCNDRIDSLKEKWRYNCEYAKFVSPKNKRRRSWSKSNIPQPDPRSIVDSLLDILKQNFDSSCIMVVKRLLFPLKKKLLIDIRDLYLNEVFTDSILKHEALYRQSHFIITDLLTYKIKLFNSSSTNSNCKCQKNRHKLSDILEFAYMLMVLSKD